jgi:lipoic acid synthetase
MAVDFDEPLRVAQAVQSLNLRHAVITSVNRDELSDGGASVFAATIREIRRLIPTCAIEVLIFIVGMGESLDEARQVMRDLQAVDCDIITIGQYLQPTKHHVPVSRFYHPDEFAQLKADGIAMGFRHVESGPLVRSSYHAEQQVGRINSHN